MTPEYSPERRLLSRALAPGKDCLNVEQLEMCVRGEAAPELSQRLEACAHCQAELELLRAFLDGPRNPNEADAVREITRRLQTPRAIPAAAPRRWWREFLQAQWFGPAAMVAAGLLIVTAVGLEWGRRGAPQIYAPGRPEDNVLRSGSLSLFAPSGDLASPPSQIRWQAIDGAAKYEVRLLEVDHSEVWSDSTSAPQTNIPQPVQARMVPAKPFLVQVRAFNSGGRKLAESGVVRFRVLPKVYTR
jgi:hypothetical protein